ncbi:hypothetical protein DFA_03469 [Cavenderia fasciculata]|uniref:Uncharacterized protein n=1 Tax=Cavenderia fasciculata TaxID=261658 RepID=F4PHN7_CACFS|nr:uncharacterized protein DFA_03469 [Cavenderia fasciculata]EGG25221.1 hypothetical protein DFA_03469 [Cavenderia fasciculata]|eukprot:XP_004363072.1 hypothetical protein DFA_03469 [Cavenderia fasciculata]
MTDNPGTVVQFHGGFWHGGPLCVTNDPILHEQRFKRTLASDTAILAKYDMIIAWEIPVGHRIRLGLENYVKSYKQGYPIDINDYALPASASKTKKKDDNNNISK